MTPSLFPFHDPLIKIECTEQFLLISLPQHYRVLSSAELNGGFAKAQYLLNLKVANCPYDKEPPALSPEETLSLFAQTHALSAATTIGMMTAASMHSLRVVSQTIENVSISVALTSGLANARRAGDPADYPHLFEPKLPQGTINIFVMINTPLQDKTMVEALSIITEAKAATLQNLHIKSPLTQQIATGTGTDATAIACAPQGNTISYCGKHTRLGETLAQLVSHALSSSILRQEQGKLTHKTATSFEAPK